jgi:uncharacterized protein (DUF1330 family)
MSAFVVVEIEVTDPQVYEDYRRQAPPTIAAHGGRYVVRGGATDLLEGEQAPHRVVVLEFASMAAARRWWESPEYQELAALRRCAARTRMFVVEGVPPGVVPA